MSKETKIFKTVIDPKYITGVLELTKMTVSRKYDFNIV